MEKKPAMLIVDDVEINRVILAQFFSDEYELFEAGNGEEALDVLENNNIDIMLLDMIMPVMDGFELLKIMQNDEKYSDIPVIATTAQNEGDAEVRAMEMGAVDFITKPYNPTIVRGWVNNVMSRRKNEKKRIRQAVQDRQMLDIRNAIEIDILTGIYNQETFFARATAFLQENQDQEYDVIVLKINGFQMLTEMFHKETGNLVLKTAAAYFRTITSEIGMCGRLGADRFVVCLPRARADMDGLLKGIDKAMNSLHVYFNIQFYAGVYSVDDVYLPVEQMIERAKVAMNTVKGKYTQRYAVYTKSMMDALSQEQMIVREMETALRNEQFCPYYQPIYSLKTGKMVSAEVLARWKHPKRGMISPAQFIPVFERNGFVVRLDQFIWEKACQFLQEQKEKYGRKLKVSVNISRINFYNPKLFDIIMSLLRKYHLEPDMLKLEITETAYSDNPHQLLETMQQFQSHGLKIMMDDFGSGYSSLNMLKNVPADILKIDMNFVRDLEQSDRAAAIMKNIVNMAKDIGMEIVVEGVETKAQIDFLAGIGCDQIQGYYFSRPIEQEAFAELIAKEQDK